MGHSYDAYYSRLYQLNPASGKRAFKYKALSVAAEFIKNFAPPELSSPTPSNEIINQWNYSLWMMVQDEGVTNKTRAIAFLSLRCYVSWRLTKVGECIIRRYAHQISDVSDVFLRLLQDGNRQIKPNIFLQQNQLVTFAGQEIVAYKEKYISLSLDILRRWQPNHERSSSLNNWTYRLAQNKAILCELGIDNSTPWYVLLNSRKWKIKLLSDVDKRLLNIFDKIYRPELDKNRTGNRYPKPTEDQLQRIVKELNNALNSEHDIHELSEKLEILANILRNCTRDSIYIDFDLDPENSNYKESLNREISEAHGNLNGAPLVAIEIEEAISDIIANQFTEMLQRAVNTIFDKHFEVLQKKHRNYAQDFHKCGYSLYCEQKSQEAIAQELDLGDQGNISRRLGSRKQHIENIEQFYLKEILQKINNDIYLDIDPDDLNEITKLIQILLREEDFSLAVREGKTRPFKSQYSAAAAQYFFQHTEKDRT
ncbi:MAG: hypothetical protein HC799_01890 [Limnothrix sp. RL_2_0]|nr:hypothetical protein [Limnothrix sp. RL_2_0]